MDAPAMERRPMKARRGVTLIELLVAMSLTGIVVGMVAGWIVHVAKQSSSAQRRDDREQNLSLLRNELHQDGTRGRTLELGRTSWKLLREHPGADPDTIQWTVDGQGLTRNGVRKLSDDTVVVGAILPHSTGLKAGWDPWMQLDRNFDGLVDPEFAADLDRFELSITLHRRAHAGVGGGEDTLRILVPLLGPG